MKARDGEELNTAFWMISWIRDGVNAVFIEMNDTRIPKLLCEYVQTGRKKLKSTKGKMERRKSMRTEKDRNSLYPVAPGVPLVLEYVSWKQEQNQAPKHFVSECILSSERCTPSYSLKFPICCLIANCCSIPFKTSGFYLYHHCLCLTLKANIFAHRATW